MSEVLFELRELVHDYPDGTAGLQGVTAAFRRGCKVAVLGANGAGKTTLFLHFVGVHRPTAGAVHYRGRPLAYDRSSLIQLRREVGMVFQDPDAQLFSASVYQDISFGPLNLNLSPSAARQRVEEALAAAGIEALAQRPTQALSYGEKKLVALAGVLAMRPEVLIWDEPTAGLDPLAAQRVIGLLDELQAGGTTIFFSTHDVDLAFAQADWCLVLAGGRLIGQGTPGTVFRDEGLLAAAHLARPWVLAVAEEMSRRGLEVDGEGDLPLSPEVLVERMVAAIDQKSQVKSSGAAIDLPLGLTGAPELFTGTDRDLGTNRSGAALPADAAAGLSHIYTLYRQPMSGAAIEAESFRRIDAETPPHDYLPEAWNVVRRLIHTTADFGLIGKVRFGGGAISAGINALRRGAPIYVDANMIRGGISLPRLQRVYAGYTPEHLHCLVAHPEVIAAAKAAGLPRSLFAVRGARPYLDGGIVLFGNAPVALLELNRMIREGEVRPALVVAMPVGFVHVEESKTELMDLNVPFICVTGRRGGSSLAVATLHALAVLAADGAL